MIPYVVKEFSLEVARDPARRLYAQTDRNVLTVPIAAGVAAVGTQFTDAGGKLYRETFPLAELYLAVEGAEPARIHLVRSRAQISLTRASEAEFPVGYWDGPYVHLRSPEGAVGTLAGTLGIQASFEIASDLSDLPARLEFDFITHLAARAAAELGRSGQQQPQ